jgi:hypothetical protein
MNLSDLKTRNVKATSLEILWPSGAVERALISDGEWIFDTAWTPYGEITDDEYEFGNAMVNKDFEELRTRTP